MAATTHFVVSATQSPSRKRWGTYAHEDFSGAELFGQALDVFRRLKKAIGGKLVIVEREIDRPTQLEFYRNNGFKSRTKHLNEKDGVIFDQMFAELNDKPSNGRNDIGL